MRGGQGSRRILGEACVPATFFFLLVVTPDLPLFCSISWRAHGTPQPPLTAGFCLGVPKERYWRKLGEGGENQGISSNLQPTHTYTRAWPPGSSGISGHGSLPSMAAAPSGQLQPLSYSHFSLCFSSLLSGGYLLLLIIVPPHSPVSSFRTLLTISSSDCGFCSLDQTWPHLAARRPSGSLPPAPAVEEGKGSLVRVAVSYLVLAAITKYQRPGSSMGSLS